MTRIGLFDSGVGGLTVLKEVMRVLPHASFVYFGDTARFPYGDKSADTLIRYSLENSSFLLKQDIDLLIVACNTASAYALHHLKTCLPIPVVGPIEAAIQELVAKTTNHRVGVIGTKGTIASEIYPRSIKALLPSAHVIARACPFLVSLVEDNLAGTTSARNIVKAYLKPIKEAGVDTLLLACTHYPLLKPEIQEAMGPQVHIVDPATALADFLAKTAVTTQEHHAPQHTFFVSGSPEHFQEIATHFLGRSVITLKAVPDTAYCIDKLELGS